MPHRKHDHQPHEHSRDTMAGHGVQSTRRMLEIVLKCDSVGSIEAVTQIISSIVDPNLSIRIIHTGVGPVSKSDLVMALTGDKLVIAFEVDIMPKLDQWVKEHGAEVRVYRVIYRIKEDLEELARTLRPEVTDERVTGKARVIARFKSSPGDLIIGCEVSDGLLVTGNRFRVISAFGPIYEGRIESLQVEKNTVKEARPGEQAGIKLTGFNRVSVGDLVECFEVTAAKKTRGWKPGGQILHI